MKKFSLILAAALLFALPGCSEGFLYAEIPGMAPASPSPSPPAPSPILLPSAAPRTSVFGLALSPVEKFQPLSDRLRYNDQAAKLCYEGLFELDERFEPQPALCLSAQTPDNAVYTLDLRPGVAFHDGSLLTPADVVYSFSQAKLPASPYAARLAGAVKAEASGDMSVTVTFSSPTFNAAALLDFPIIKNGSAGDAVAPGTGPYRFVLGEDSPYLLAWDGWWKGKEPPLPRIELVEVSSADEMVYWFQTGYISVAALDPYGSFSPVLRTGYESWEYQSGELVYFGFNTAKKPFDSLDMRRIASLALDREALTASVYGAAAFPSALTVPPGSFLYSRAEAARYARDPGEASRMLSDMGYYDTDGDGVLELEPYQRVFEPLEITIIVGSENIWRARVAEGFAQSLREIGFWVTVRRLTWSDFGGAIESGEYDIFCAEASQSPNFSPEPFVLPDGVFNGGKYDSPFISDLAAGLNAAPPQERQAALDAVFSAVYGELPFLTVCFRSMSLQVQRGLASGPTPVWQNPFYRWEDWNISPLR